MLRIPQTVETLPAGGHAAGPAGTHGANHLIRCEMVFEYRCAFPSEVSILLKSMWVGQYISQIV